MSKHDQAMRGDFEAECDIAREGFEHHNAQFSPMVRLDTDGDTVIAVIDVGGIQKWEAVAKLCSMQPTHRVIFIADTWMRSMAVDSAAAREFEESGKRVSEYDDKFEALIVNLIERDRFETAIYPYDRKGGGKDANDHSTIIWRPDLLPPDGLEGSRIESLGVSLVRTELVPIS